MKILVGDLRLFVDVEGSSLRVDGPQMRQAPTLLLLHGVRSLIIRCLSLSIPSYAMPRNWFISIIEGAVAVSVATARNGILSSGETMFTRFAMLSKLR